MSGSAMPHTAQLELMQVLFLIQTEGKDHRADWAEAFLTRQTILIKGKNLTNGILKTISMLDVAVD